jgi:hypothetical protein
MASPPNPTPASLEDTQPAPAEGSSQPADIDKVRVEDGKKKKKTKRSAGAKKRGTGFEGKF